MMSECKHEWVRWGDNEHRNCKHCTMMEEEYLRQQLQAAEQQNAQLRADLAHRDAECAGYRVTLDDIASGAYTFPSKVAEAALATSSGKDILEHMRVMQELIEAARLVCNLSECDYSYQFMERVIKLREILAKVKGHKNEWGDY